mmetsp:Transcript_2551/g.6654  ORF Transcript_2551/g.6654 Transcript_2551/m.6654 type:complete len:81 (+) Transcript_2551:1009-1251(+)
MAVLDQNCLCLTNHYSDVGVLNSDDYRGYRYELHCIAKAAGERHGAVAQEATTTTAAAAPEKKASSCPCSKRRRRIYTHG